ncbi:hypothetical protein IGI37_000270 [Enterococcus sp. AZ194]|uniref:hypothetical protein n=1 Tax=Enterococcus sp. AZ194 TaxID=2774629 RepID=UPI003F2338E6
MKKIITNIKTKVTNKDWWVPPVVILIVLSNLFFLLLTFLHPETMLPLLLIVIIYIYYTGNIRHQEKGLKLQKANNDIEYTINRMNTLGILGFGYSDIASPELKSSKKIIPSLIIRLEIEISKELTEKSKNITLEQFTFEAQQILFEKFSRDSCFESYQVNRCEIVENQNTDTFIFILSDTYNFLIRENVYTGDDNDF